MTVPDQAKRRIIPRWRSFDATAATSELASDPAGIPKVLPGEQDEFLADKLREWEETPSIGVAVDILSSAVVLGRAGEFEAIGWWILTRPEKFSDAVVDLASLCAKGAAAGITQPYRKSLEVRAFLRRSRSMLANNPRDAVLRVDTALGFAMTGNVEKAEQQIKAAVQLAPDNRFVLRSAARFWVHRRDPGRAREILLRSARTPVDPWLMAGELSISGLAGKSPKFFSKARVLLHQREGSPNQLSELAGSVGTLEAIGGRRNKAKAFFQQSLVDPTENTVAQAVWAANERVLPEFSTTQFSHLKPAEAEAWQARAQMNWNSAITACHTWCEQEPFSSIPFAMGSFITSMIDHYAETKLFCAAGLQSNPDSYDLRNNLAVALFFERENDAALNVMSSISHISRNAEQTAVWAATTGLALFCTGSDDDARGAYRKSIDLALKAGKRETGAFAAAYWVKAEMAFGHDPAAALEAFYQNAGALNSPEVQYFKTRFNERKSSI